MNMNEAVEQPQDRLAIVFPLEPTPGALGVVVPENRTGELRALENERQLRVWRVRGIVSDHIPLAGSIADGLARPPQHMMFLNENPLSVYLHHGGDNAIYYDFVGDESGYLQYIEVRVETELPSNAFLYARQPLNEMLDTMARSEPQMPLILQRLELVSPRDDGILAYELILPFSGGVRMGPLGGIWQSPPFASYEAIFREAIISTSPFYRLLCACRVYEGTNWIRRWIRDRCTQFGIDERMPRDPTVDVAELARMGFTPQFCEGIRTAADLFERLREHRNGIAHFLIEGEQGEAHIYVARGEVIHEYSLGAAVLLRYAARVINDLHRFYTTHLYGRLSLGSILPTPENRDRFIIRPPRG